MGVSGFMVVLNLLQNGQINLRKGDGQKNKSEKPLQKGNNLMR